MKGNRRRDTSPEILIRRTLHSRGWRYRVDFAVSAGTIKTRADIVFTRRRVAVFIDGCFWHGCPEHSKIPRTNTAYWAAKIGGNRERDGQVTAALLNDGWTVLRIWEHMPLQEAIQMIEVALA